MTSREVAKAAGVSQATVSNVLNRPELVAPETRQRVREVIDSLGFVVNDGARQLRAGRSSVLAVSVLDVGNPFWADVTRGVADYAVERGFMIALASTNESVEREHRYLRLFEEQRVAGMLVAPVGSDLAGLRRMASSGTTVVLLDTKDPEGDLPYVAVDDVEGGYVARSSRSCSTCCSRGSSSRALPQDPSRADALRSTTRARETLDPCDSI